MSLYVNTDDFKLIVQMIDASGTLKVRAKQPQTQTQCQPCVFAVTTMLQAQETCVAYVKASGTRTHHSISSGKDYI